MVGKASLQLFARFISRTHELAHMKTLASEKQVILFVGGGQMASALIGALVKDGWPADRILVHFRRRHARSASMTACRANLFYKSSVVP
jgi:lysine/ornithine N-monooxygenase